MLDLIVIVIFGTIFAYFATQNTTGVDIRLAGAMLSQIPLYIIVLGSMIIGLVLASLLHYIDSLFTFFKFQSKNRAVGTLESRVKSLEAENARLRGDKDEMRTEEKIHDKTLHPNPIDKLRRRLV